MKDGFGTYHPLANLIFFVAVMVCTMAFDDPVILAVSLLGSVTYAGLIKGRRAMAIVLKGAMPIIIFTAILNPLFSHGGVTPLFVLPSGNAFTLEAVLFGLSAGCKLAAMVLWFYCLNFIITGDKIIYIFGRISPYFALTLSLIMGFIPVIKNKFIISYEAQAQFGAKKIVTAGRCLLATAGWAIEEAADTAESMRGRGFGLKGRTSFNIYFLETKDVVFIGVCALIFISLIIMKGFGAFDFYFYPYVKSFGSDIRFLGALAYLFMCLMPIIICCKERRRMK